MRIKFLLIAPLFLLGAACSSQPTKPSKEVVPDYTGMHDNSASYKAIPNPQRLATLQLTKGMYGNEKAIPISNAYYKAAKSGVYKQVENTSNGMNQVGGNVLAVGAVGIPLTASEGVVAVGGLTLFQDVYGFLSDDHIRYQSGGYNLKRAYDTAAEARKAAFDKMVNRVKLMAKSNNWSVKCLSNSCEDHFEHKANITRVFELDTNEGSIVPVGFENTKSFFVSISLDTPVPASKDYPGFIPLYGYEPKWVGFSNVVMTTSVDPNSPLDRDFHSYLTYDKNSIVSKNPSGRRFLTTFLFYDTAFSQSQYVDVEENLMFNNSVFAMSTNKVPFVYKESFNLCKNTPLNYCK